MISIIRWILATGLEAELFLVFANNSEADIIFRDEWESNAREHAHFHVYHVLEQPPAGWTQGRGRITEEILRGHLPAPASDTAVFLCGPPLMVDALERTLQDIGYSEQSIILP
jgi:cytochrome-b5 reductase